MGAGHCRWQFNGRDAALSAVAIARYPQSTHPLEAALSLLLLAIEVFMMAGYGLQLYLLLHIKNRRPEADAAALAVKSGHYQPWVDIFIPTYNEPLTILRRTIVGCQALDYPHKRIYVLDDTRRPALRELACELGCEYLSRPDNRHAKAGNLNHALTQTKGELIAVFDADFVPTRNFLTRTVGFFQTPDIGLVQTYQSFYNPDPIARNLGLEDHLPQEVEIFSRHYQVLRDGIETALCYGSSFVVRRSASRPLAALLLNPSARTTTQEFNWRQQVIG